MMKPNFKSGTLLGPDLMSCEMGKSESRNEQTSLSVLDQSKTIMYEFH